MGWTFIRETPYKTSEELIADELRPWTVVDMCSKPREDHSGGKGVVYVAAEMDGQIDSFIILLCRENKGELGLKVMHEDDEPYYYGATKKLIKQLSPTTSENATAWRRKCGGAK
jgi:hypothetical protein